MTYEEALNAIHAVHWQGHKPGLGRTRALLAALGDPHKALRFVHVAGTNGKGSTAAMLDSCLRAAGYKTGLFTSPYINRFNERVQVDGVPIPDGDLVRLVERVQPAAAAMADTPTEFEFITALGMLWFAEQRCDIVVLEVGLGGALDSTNVIDPPECAVITALGLDHVKELGPTMADIASAKAGIIKSGGDVVIYGGNPEADPVFEQVCQEKGARLHKADFSAIVPGPFDLDGQHIDSTARTPYNIYNTLSAYTALKTAGAGYRTFKTMIEAFDYGNNRESIFHIKGAKVQLHLAKNPIGFQQKVSLVLKDPDPKDIIIQINDTSQDGTDISWLWDVDFQYLGDSNAASITTAGTRKYDMGLRLKYEDIPCSSTTDMRSAILDLVKNGTKNLYVIVNYSGLYRTNHLLTELEKGTEGGQSR